MSIGLLLLIPIGAGLILLAVRLVRDSHRYEKRWRERIDPPDSPLHHMAEDLRQHRRALKTRMVTGLAYLALGVALIAYSLVRLFWPPAGG
jgi:hypothetical protein